MIFKNRKDAGILLAQKLQEYTLQEVIVYGIPRGGVVTAHEIAKKLDAPLDIIITRKIGHPKEQEYAIAAVSENGYVIGDKKELNEVSSTWLKKEVRKEKKEAERRRKIFGSGIHLSSVHHKIAIVVDDGIATGWTLKAALLDLKKNLPRKIIIAVPVIPRSIYEELSAECEVIALVVPSSDIFLGAVGMYYENFTQVSDDEVRNILKEHKTFLNNYKKEYVFWENRMR